MRFASVSLFGAVLLGIFAFVVNVRASDVLTNPGFESGKAVAPWNKYGPNIYLETSALLAHHGTNYLKLYQQFNGTVNDTHAYQDNLSGPGAVYAADGWAYTAASDVIAGQNAAWLEVTFRDINANILALYRSALITTGAVANKTFPASTWIDLPVTNQYDPSKLVVTNHTTALVAPAGTSFVRYQVTFQGDANNSAGSVYFDDLNLTQTSGGPQGNWNIVWSDEFNGASINTNVWTYDTGNNNGWGNKELEYYTKSSLNSYVSGGLLHIVALQQSVSGFNYTSARLKTEGLYSATYGRFEFRASLPHGTGFWPALWLLGDNIDSIGWPSCGEIDIMENSGTDLTNVQGSLHSGSDETQIYALPPGGSVTNFHQYLLEWTSNAISFYVDGIPYETQTNWSDSAGGYPTPFNKPFFIIMNLAVGGNYVGNPTMAAINAGAAFPGQMLVDYVRLYNLTPPLQLAAADGAGKLSLTWPTNIICHLESAASLSGSTWTNVAGATSPFTPALSAPAFYRLVSP